MRGGRWSWLEQSIIGLLTLAWAVFALIEHAFVLWVVIYFVLAALLFVNAIASKIKYDQLVRSTEIDENADLVEPQPVSDAPAE